MADKPKASSTPKFVDIRPRRRIRDSINQSLQSPIHPLGESSKVEYPGYSEDEHFPLSDSDNEVDGRLEHKDTKDPINTTFCNCVSSSVVIMISIIGFGMLFLYCVGNTNSKIEETTTLESLSQEFPSQVDNFWLYIKVGIEEITKYHQPKTFIFLYTDQSYETLTKILEEISKFAVCALTNCLEVPVVLEGNDLNTTDILEDYGKIISMYKGELEESGVMIIKNLQKIPGISAQAFHSFCDEYNPVVERALFIFTMKVDKIHNNNLKFVENYLYKLWHDIREDKFYPLFTRISGNVLPIMGESKT